MGELRSIFFPLFLSGGHFTNESYLFLASLVSPQRLVNISYTHYSKFKGLQPTAHTYTHSPGLLLCLGGIFNFSVSAHI